MARHDEVADDVRQRITLGEYQPGDKLPGYRELRVTYGASAGVIRLAMSQLEAEGLVEIVKKRGITVRPPAQRRRITRDTLIQRSPSVGYVFPGAARVDEVWRPMPPGPRRSFETVPNDVAELLGVQAGTEVLRRRRVMAPEGEPPFDITTTWIHPEAIAEAPQVAEISTGPGGYLDRLEEAGHGPLTWVERIRTRMPTGEEARALEMPRAGMPVLELTRIGSSARTGQPVEVTVVLSPGDRVEVVNTLRRGKSASWPTTPITS